MTEPVLRASMYYQYNGEARPGIEAASTFEAARLGQRVATTRFPSWPQYNKWSSVIMGDRFRVYSDRECVGPSLDCIATADAQPVGHDLSDRFLEEWSRLEGWSVGFGKRLFVRNGEGLQIRFRIAGPDDRFVGGLF